MPYGLVTLVELVLLVYCVLDVVRTPADQARNLPKLLWLLVVVLVPIIGPVAWLVAGRPAHGRGADRTPLASGGSAGRARPRRPVTMSPDDDEDFLRGLRDRAAEQRRQAEEEQRRRDGGGPTSAAPGSGPA